MTAGGAYRTATGTGRVAADAPMPCSVGLLLVLLAFVPLLGAQFGIGNQVEQFSIIERLRDPGFALNDFYVDSATGFGPRFYYAQAMARLAAVLPLPVLVHSLALLCNLGIAAVSYVAARRLLDAPVAAGVLAAILAVTNGGFSLGYAGYIRFDSFQPASLAIPLALLGLLWQLELRPFRALAPFVAASLLHPLIGVEIALVAYGAAGLSVLLAPPAEGRLRPILPMVAAGFVFTAALAIAYFWPMVGSSGAHLPDAEFFAILAAFRAPHHYLGLQMSSWEYRSFAYFLIALILLFGWALRSRGADRRLVALGLAVGLVVLACAASLYFVDIRHERAWTTAQLFRMLLIVKWVGYLLLSCLVARVMADNRFGGAVLAACVVLATADAQPRTMLLAVLFASGAALAQRRAGPRLAAVLRGAGLAGVALLSAWFIHRYAPERDVMRAALALLLATLLLAPLPGPAALRRGAAVTLTLAVLAVTLMARPDGPFGIDALQSSLTWDDRRAPAETAARLAGAASPPGAVWVIAPDNEGFRLLSRRAAVVDFTSIPFEDAAMAEWKRRIDGLYGPHRRGGMAALAQMKERYRAGIDWKAAMTDFGATHALLHSATPWNGPVLFDNGTFKGVRLDDGALR